jgi:uncharacterized protein YyaL (SSP411 family)
MTNRLAEETSPYLLQHAHNPVDWYPWGPEALARAKAEDRPVFLSIGYSACHWCHVMERESFEDPGTAKLMNQLFVNIKVDREERPDVDEIYMRAVQALTGHGGWPMSMFLTPDMRPFFGGTYFPPSPRQGMPGFRQVLQHAENLYRTQPDGVHRMTTRMVEMLDQGGRLPAPEGTLRDDWLPAVSQACAAAYDRVDGGFGNAPKFPPHGVLAVLLAHHHRTGDADALNMATHTLDAMAKGGMYDHLAGGFARYSVDDEWRIPHFEKMLYDNGQLIPVYVDAHLVTGSAHYARVVRESVGWLLREMRLDHGGFAAATDADSEGEEGKYFSWTPRQLREVLGIVDGTRVATLVQITDTGTFEHGTSVIRLEEPFESLSEADRALLERAFPRLKAVRDERIAPGRDDKVVTAWNALAIGALSRAASALDEPSWAEAAAATARFLLEDVTVDGRLMRTFKDGQARVLGYADDHAFLVSALIDLYQATFEAHWLEAANRLADQTVALFWDDEAGGLFYTGNDAERLVTRSKNMIGGAEPSSNGTAAHAFARLSALSGRSDLGDRADLILRSYQPLVEPAARALGVEALAAGWRTGAVCEAGVVGAEDSADTRAMIAATRNRYLPFTVISHLSPGQSTAHVPWMAERTGGAQPTAFLCERGTCQLPVTDLAQWQSQLAQIGAADKPTPAASSEVVAPDRGR